MWRRGSVVGSWLLDLTAIALHESPDLHEFSGRVSDSGEGRWTAIAAIDEGVPAPALTTALQSRFASRSLDDFANKALSAMRKQFGGHAEKPCRRSWRRPGHAGRVANVTTTSLKASLSSPAAVWPASDSSTNSALGTVSRKCRTPSGLTTSESLPRISSTGIVRSAAALFEVLGAQFRVVARAWS